METDKESLRRYWREQKRRERSTEEGRQRHRDCEKRRREAQNLSWNNMAREVEKSAEEAWNEKPTRRRVQRMGKDISMDRNRYRETALVELNKTTRAYKYIVGHITQIMEDLGGEENLSFNQRALVEQAALCREWLSQHWKKWVEDEENFDIEKVMKVQRTMQNIMKELGLERRAKEIDDLSSIIRKEKGGSNNG